MLLVVASTVMRVLYQTALVKRELSSRAKLLIYQSSYIPTLTYIHELLKVTKRFRIQAAKISILCRVVGEVFNIGVETSGEAQNNAAASSY